MRRVKVGALEALLVSLSVARASCSTVTLPDTAHELDIATKSPVSQCVRNEV